MNLTEDHPVVQAILDLKMSDKTKLVALSELIWIDEQNPNYFPSFARFSGTGVWIDPETGKAYHFKI